MAEAIVRTIADPDRQAEALTAIADAAMAVGVKAAKSDADRAAAIIRAIPDLDGQGLLLARVARTLAAQPGAARRFLGHTFTAQEWAGPLIARAIVDPQLVRDVAHQVWP